MADDQTTNETQQATSDPAAAEARPPAPQDSAPQDPAPEGSGQPEAPVDSAPSISDLLAEYDDALPVAKAGEPDRGADADRVGDAGDTTPGADPRGDPRIGALIDVVRAQELERLQAREDADAKKVLTDAKQAIAEFANKVPEDFAERWLMSEYQLNPRLSAAWNQRHESPAAMERAERAVERALKDLHRAVQNVPEAKATADQEAVAAALRGATAGQPSGTAPDYGRMTDGEFRKSVEDEHGYTPGV